MEFFNGFKWAMPKAFSDSLAACRFEEGDTLYDTQKAYDGNWGKSQKHIHYHIQVREPSRISTDTTGSKEISGSTFNKNWNSEVFFELIHHKKRTIPKYIRTTQGRLYSALWRGDLSILDKANPNPKPPAQLRQVSKNLESVVNYAIEIAGSKPVFIMARDSTSKISKNKHLSIKSILHSKFGAVNHTHNLSDTSISPTIDIVFYIMNRGDYQSIHDALKEKLYTPAKNAKKDMFRLKAHGLLIVD